MFRRKPKKTLKKICRKPKKPDSPPIPKPDPMPHIRDHQSTLVKNSEKLMELIRCCAPIKSYRLESSLKMEGIGVRGIISSQRRMGAPICSSRDGYYLATRKCDLDGTICHMRGRRNALDLVLKALENTQESLSE